MIFFLCLGGDCKFSCKCKSKIHYRPKLPNAKKKKKKSAVNYLVVSTRENHNLATLVRQCVRTKRTDLLKRVLDRSMIILVLRINSFRA